MTDYKAQEGRAALQEFFRQTDQQHRIVFDWDLIAKAAISSQVPTTETPEQAACRLRELVGIVPMERDDVLNLVLRAFPNEVVSESAAWLGVWNKFSRRAKL